MEIRITQPQTGVIAVTGASLWENEDGVHIKPKGTHTVKAEYIDGFDKWEEEDAEHIKPTDSGKVYATHIDGLLTEQEDSTHIKPIDSLLIKAEYIDGLLIEQEDTTHVKPVGSNLINADYIDGLPSANANTKAPMAFIGGVLTTSLKAYIPPLPCGMTISAIRVACSGNVSDSDLIIDINKNGTTLYTTQANRPTIATGTSAVTATLPDVVALSANDILSVDIDQVGTAQNLMVTIICNL